MKRLLPLLSLLVLSGCASYPNAKCDSWVHDGNYGPFVTTHYEAKGAVIKDNVLSMSNWTGKVAIFGYSVSDAMTNLEVPLPIKPK